RDALLAASAAPAIDPRPREYTIYQRLPADTLAAQRARFAQALTMAPTSTALNWGLGRLLLATGDATAAAAPLQAACGQGCANALLYQDTIVALAHSTPDDSWTTPVLALYEAAPPPVPTRTISDTVALAAMVSGSAADLERAYTLRPADLFLTYRRWQQAAAAGNTAEAEAYRLTLAAPPLAAVTPRDERLLTYAAETIPLLLQEGIWDNYTTRQVVTLLVWRYAAVPGVTSLLEELRNNDTRSSLWTFLLAEAHHRAGQHTQAAALYQQALELTPPQPEALLRLGMLAEQATPPDWVQAAEYYAAYYERAPDDLLGLERLAMACETLTRSDTRSAACAEAAAAMPAADTQTGSAAAQIQRTWLQTSHVELIAAQMLELPEDAVRVRPTILPDRTLQRGIGGRSAWWVWYDPNALDDPARSIVAQGFNHLDIPDNATALRVGGLWPVELTAPQSQGIAGFIAWNAEDHIYQRLTLAQGEPYLVSFDYRTITAWGQPRISLTQQQRVLWQGAHTLPKTDGAWYRVVALGWNRSGGEASITPFLLYNAPGFVEFANITVQPVQLPATVRPTETQFRIIGHPEGSEG
ncbi:MAG: tetratricopeptide repeat protein, partial [Chloroflexaceae bacterium]|nr:tetratricopeptide repeat protein [Chloroflexaceae bacterium]